MYLDKQYGLVAQRIEHPPSKRTVAGSNPAEPIAENVLWKARRKGGRSFLEGTTGLCATSVERSMATGRKSASRAEWTSLTQKERERMAQIWDPMPGDVVFCWGSDLVSRVITLKSSVTNAMTLSGLSVAPSHAAIIAPFHGSQAWYESTTKCSLECLSAKRQVSGVQVHWIYPRLSMYTNIGGSVTVLRGPRPISGRIVSEWMEPLLGDEGTGPAAYDYIAAVVSGTRARSLPVTPSFSDRWFCSELVTESLRQAGAIDERVEPHKQNPGSLMRLLLRSGWKKVR